jgi:S1-C subfamily serine protease
MEATMKKLSDAVADAIESAAKSIVRVDGGRRTPSSGIAWADDVVITAAHTLRNDEGVIGWDPATDVAVLRMGKGLQPIEWSDAADLRVGNFAIAAGRPGRSTRATFGIISALGGEWRTSVGGRIDRYIEVDAALPPGFSGGPLLDVDGKAIGMNTSRLMRSGTTIPIATLRRVVGSILEHGSVRRAFLGVGVHPVEGGLIVMSLAPEGPAKKSGVLIGDIITTLDGEAVSDPASLHEMLREERIGSEATLHITRGGEPREVRMTIGAM